MIKNILILILIMFSGWIVVNYFNIKLPMGNSQEIIQSTTTTIFKQKEKKEEKKFSLNKKQNKENIIGLDILLSENRFYDALSFYLENNTEVNRKKIENYLYTLAKSEPNKALEYMQVFFDNVPQSSVLNLMIKTHIAQGDLYRAIELIIQAKENTVSQMEEKRFSEQLREVAIQYIDKLMKHEEYGHLIAFLEEMIDYDNSNGYYSFRLAQLYMKLDKVDEASMLLTDLQYDEVYAQNVKTLLQSIEKENNGDDYKYAIALKKYGDHYAVNVYLNGTPFTLMLDTGATYILLDEDKASSLEVIRDDILLQTAGDDVRAKLCRASRMSLGNLEISNIKITAAPFKRDQIDGLLGMNFLKQFTFFINQEENILYLNPKKKIIKDKGLQ